MNGRRRELMRLLQAARVEVAEGIAVIGLAGRYPGAESPDELWVRVRGGESCISEFADRRQHAERRDAPPAGRRWWAGQLDHADGFDPLFFGIAPVEAENMDPQERVFLEITWAALEDAGYPPRRLAERSNPVGVFVGVMNSDYERIGGEAAASGAANEAHSSHWSIANRVSYVLDFRGPSLAVNTACSASLTAIHLACQSLRAGECSVAIAGGVNLILHTGHLRTLADNGMTSPGEECRSFGRGADGFVDGEGVGAVLLKPLSRAVTDGDRIYGVIRASAVNAGGKTGGYTVPSARAQAEVIRTCLRQGAIDPRTIGCVEAHGTGTPLGDPIEVSGLAEAFRERLDDQLSAGVERCALGSVKSNVGHLESAAGIVGLTKVLMQLRSGELAPSLHSRELNPDIDFGGTPFFVPQERLPWPRIAAVDGSGQQVELPRRAGVSSFGGGGANAHLIVEEHLEPDDARPSSPAGEPELIVLSARDEDRLRASAGRLAAFLTLAGQTVATGSTGRDSERPRLEVECSLLVAGVLGVGATELDGDTPLRDYGFGPVELAGLTDALAEHFGEAAGGGVVAGSDTIRSLAGRLGETSPEPGANRVRLDDLAYTLQTGREGMEVRLALVATTVDEASGGLRAFASAGSAPGVLTGAVPAGRPNDEIRDLAADALRRGDRQALAEAWIRGADIDWSILWRDRSARRVGLPTYPFARKRYWLADPEPKQAGGEPSEPSVGPAPPTAGEIVCYRPGWVPEPLTRDADAGRADGRAAGGSPGRRRVLILSTAEATWLAESIAGGHQADEITIVDLDHEDVVGALARGPIDRVYHLGGVVAGGHPDSLERSLARGARVIWQLAGNLVTAGSRVDLTVVTNDAVAAFGGGVTNPFAAALHGMARVLPKERPEIRTVCLDFSRQEIAQDEGAADSLLRAVLAEPCTFSGRTVVWRRAQRHAFAVQPVQLAEPQQPPFRERGAYVIVGGSGGIGRALTTHLAERCRARVAWVTRSELGPEQLECVEQARRLGGDVLHVRADCSDADQLRRAAAKVKAAFGKLHGLIHAGMTFAPGPLATLDEQAFHAALGVKAQGSVATDQVFGDEALDFMAFFSSVGAFAGTAGNGPYSGGAALQDAFALYLRSERPYPVFTINWGYWGEIGSGARPGLQAIFNELGIGELSVPEGLAALTRVLAGPLPQVMPIRARASALAALGATSAAASDPATVRDRPPLRSIAAALRQPHAAAAPEIERVLAGHDRLDQLCRAAVLDVFRRMGALVSLDRRTLLERLGIQSKYGRLCDALLNILRRDGHIRFENERVVLLTATSDGHDALEDQFEQLARDHPDLAATVTLTRLFLASYPEILRGQVRATEVMFPGSSLALVEGFYKANPLTDSFNELVRDAVRGYVEQRACEVGGRVRILELGAGTGATTATVLPALAPYADRVTYCFTDISPRFLEHGRDQFSGTYDTPGLLEYRVLDLERAIEEQGFVAGTYDLVLATNVVHATRNLRATLGKAKRLLGPQGWLVLNELTEVRDAATVVGGLLDGWWLFDDPELRLPDAPLCPPETWCHLMEETGFADMVVAGGGAPGGRGRGQHVIVGESDGRHLSASGPPRRPAALAPAAAPSSVAPTPGSDPGAPVSSASAVDLLDALRPIVARALKLDQLPDPDRPLASYGFDSLTGMKIVSAIADDLGLSVELADFYEHPTLRELARSHAQRACVGRPSGVALAPPAEAALAVTAPTDHDLSEGQRALWVIEAMEPGSSAYNLPLAFWLDADVDAVALRQTIQGMVDRHDSLRSVIRTAGGRPVRTVAPWQELHFQQRYLAVSDTEAVRRHIREEAQRPLDLEHGPLLRVTVFTLGDGRHVLLLVVHHIVFDGVSIAAFLRELGSGYRAVLDERPTEHPSPAATFDEFTAWQRELLAGPEGERLRAYWMERLADGIEPLDLPYDRPRPAVLSHRGASIEGRIDAELLQAARAFAAERRTSLFAVVLSGLFALLHRYTGQRGIRVGTPTAGRPSARFEGTLGYFMNMLVLEREVDPGESFATLTGHVHTTVLEGLAHGHYPLISLSEAMRQAGRRDAAEPFRVACYFQNWVEPRDMRPVAGVFDGVHQEGEFDLVLDVVEGETECGLTLKYHPDLFDEGTVRRLRDHFLHLLHSALAAPVREIGRLALLTGEEQRQLEARWQQARRDYPRGQTLTELIEEQAARRPGAIAVTFGSDALSYGALLQRVDRLAGDLRRRGVAQGRTVGVLVERSPELLVALLAVLKAGGAYVPLDPAFPAERLRYMVQDAQLHLMLTTGRTEPALGVTTVPAIRVDQPTADSGPMPDPSTPVPGSARPEDIAYVIYTSGSTGRPKGVAVPHRALVNFLTSMRREPGFGPDDTMLALTTVSFDIAALELFLPLIAGGRVELVPDDVAKDGLKLRRHLEGSGATVVQATPSGWKMLLAAGWRGERTVTALCGGEALDQDTADMLAAGTAAAWNLYGPTETTIWSTLERLHPGQPVTIGRAIANTQLLVLDERRELVPIGVPGELYIGGDGVANGYLGRPDLTAERFVANPFDPSLSARLYRTGDVVRALPDGRLEYLGRADTQVKIRSHRIEPGEVEAALRRLPGVADAVVVPAPAPDGSGAMLRGFYTLDEAHDGTFVDPGPLGEWLPAYMVPDVLVALTDFPYTPNTKVDRARLSATPLSELRAEFGAARAEADDATQPAAAETGPLPGTDGTSTADVEVCLADELAGLVGEIAEVAPEDVPRSRPLGELGISSVGFTALSARIGDVFGVEIYPSAFYGLPALEAIAAHLVGADQARFRTRYRDRARPAATPPPRPETATPSPPGWAPASADSSTAVAGRRSPVAIIGMAGRLPRSPDIDTFWQHLTAGDDLIEEIPAERWDWRAVAGDPHEGEYSRSRWGGFVPDVDRFDAAFFGISPREAELMDPQQRLLLEVVWTALEDAGLRPSELAGRRVGVFIGVTNSDYLEVQRAAGRATDAHTITGAALSVIPNRVSYLLDLRGPSLAVDTACSSSLTAIDLAISAVRDGTCELAIAGGVSLILDPSLYVALSKSEMLSQNGRCKAFDERADGYVRGEGVGVVVLKDAGAASRDGDPVHALITGSAVNHGGRTNSLTAPSPDAQANVIVEAHREAGIDPATVGYIEAHGTGTALGDPVEVAGLKSAFAQLESAEGLGHTPLGCGIGSVKSNVGHLEAAAGIAGLFKVVLAMKYQAIPASLHVEELNRYLDLEDSPFHVVTETVAWPARRDDRGAPLPRRAGISSFGFGGAGAHLVLEEAAAPGTAGADT
jgi:amino acid adenylation domain-containing protein